MRAAIYARYSSDLQSASSVADQLRICRRFAAQIGAQVVQEFTDAAISGKTLAERPGGSGEKRPTRLLSGLVRCGFCNGPMVMYGPHQAMVCRDRAIKGKACANERRPGYPILEDRVLASIKANLLHPDVVADAAREYQRAMAEHQKTAARERGRWERELAEIERRQAHLIAQVEGGMPWAAISKRHGELEAQAEAIRGRLAERSADVITLHPSAPKLFRDFVLALSRLLDEPAGHHAAQARQAIRGLIEEVRFLPREGKGKYELAITANLAPVLQKPLQSASLGGGLATVVHPPRGDGPQLRVMLKG